VIAKTVRAALPLLLGVLLLSTPPATDAASRNAAPANNTELQAELEGYISGLNGTYGVSAVSLSDGSGVFVNDETLFPAASMYKLLVMYRIFQATDRGQLSWSDTVTIRDSDFEEGDGTMWYPGEQITVSHALWGMIAQSSNVAAYALMRQIGGPDSVAMAAEELGMTSTTRDPGFWSTPVDMARFFYLLAKGQLVSPSASREMVDILLLQQQENDRIPLLLPEEARVPHKTGEDGSVVNDGGIIFGPGGDFVLVIMSQGGALDDEYFAEAKVSQMIYQQYGQ